MGRKSKAEETRVGNDVEKFRSDLGLSRQELAERVARANADIEAARKAAVADLQAQSAMLATEIASKILRRQVNDQDNQRLVQESLQELGSSRR